MLSFRPESWLALGSITPLGVDLGVSFKEIVFSASSGKGCTAVFDSLPGTKSQSEAIQDMKNKPLFTRVLAFFCP